MDVLARRGQADRKQNLPSSVPLDRLPAEGVAQMKGVPSCLKAEVVFRVEADLNHFKPRIKSAPGVPSTSEL